MKIHLPTSVTTRVISFLILFCYPVSLCHALPSDPTVVSGQAQFEHVNSNTLNIKASANSILEYSSFNIGQGETVNFFLPSADSFSLNRILGGSMSDISGNLFSNGNLILTNMFGFNFGATSNIETHGLIASTLNIGNENFLAGNYTFTNNGAGPFSSIINDGKMQMNDGGFAVLIAPAVENNGTISAPLGTVALASGDFVTVGISRDNAVSVAVNQPVSGQVLDSKGNAVADQIKNTGNINADGGKIILNAKGRNDLFNQVINMEGHVRADHAEIGKDGSIEIISSGKNTLGGDISASGDITISTPDSAEFTQAENSSLSAGKDFTIGEGVSLNASDTQYTIGGDWDNSGVFNPETSTVTFNNASNVSHIYGDNSFYNFSVYTPEKVIAFENGSTQTIQGAWTILGAYAEHVRLISTQAGEQWKVNPAGTYSFDYAWVEDSYNLGSEEIIMRESTNRGNSYNWDPTGTWTNGSGNNLWSDPGNWSGLGGATPGAGDDVVFNGTSTAGSSVDGGFAGFVGSITLANGYGGTLALGRNLTVTTASGRSGNLTSTGSNISLNAHTLTLMGNLTLSTSLFNSAGSILDFAGSGTQTFTPSSSGQTFSNIIHSGSGTLSLIAPIAITGSLAINAGTFDLNGQDLNMSGATYSNDGTLSLRGSETITNLSQDTNSGTTKFTGNGNGSADTYYVDGGNFAGSFYNLAIASTDSADIFVNNGSSVLTAGTMTLSNGTYTVGGTGTTTVSGLATISGGTYDDSSGSTQTFSTGLNVSGGTFTGGAGRVNVNASLAISGSSTFTAPSGDLHIWNDFTVSGTPTFNHNNGTVIFDSPSSIQTFTTNGITLNNLTLDNSAGPDIIISGNLDVNGNLLITAGKLNLSTNDPNVNVAGNMTVATGGSLDISSYTGIFTFDGSGTSTLMDNTVGGINFGSITVDGTSKTLQLSGSSPGLTFNTLTIGSDDTFSVNAKAVTISTLSNNGTFKLRGNETITLAANDTDSGTWVYTGDGDSAIDGYTVKDFGATDYYNLTIASVDSVDTYAPASAKTIAGALTVSGGAFNPSGNTTTVGGLTTVSGGSYSAGGGTQTFNGGLTVSGGVFTGSSGDVDVNGILTLSSGTLVAPTTNANFTISDDFLFTGGTFTHNNGKVTLDSTTNATLDAPNTGLAFYDFQIASSAGKTVQFTGGDTFTVFNANTFTVGNNAALTSTNTSAWNLNINNSGGSDTGITFGSGVSIAYANNTSTNTINALTVTNGGNNTRFNFGAGSGGSSSSGGTSGSGGIDSGINSGLGGLQNSGSSSSGGDSLQNNTGGNDSGHSNSGSGNNQNGGNGSGGPQQPSGARNYDFYFDDPKKTRTKVSCIEGSVYVVDKLMRIKILRKNQSTTVGEMTRDDFKDSFYVNFRTPGKYKTTVQGQAYTVYLDQEQKNAIFFITKDTGPVTFPYGAKPVVNQIATTTEKTNAK